MTVIFPKMASILRLGNAIIFGLRLFLVCLFFISKNIINLFLFCSIVIVCIQQLHFAY